MSDSSDDYEINQSGSINCKHGDWPHDCPKCEKENNRERRRRNVKHRERAEKIVVLSHTSAQLVREITCALRAVELETAGRCAKVAGEYSTGAGYAIRALIPDEGGPHEEES